MSSDLTLEQSTKCFDGYQYVYSHDSETVEGRMQFGVYVPDIADDQCVPLLIFLSSFGCNEQSFISKFGVQRLASKYGFIVANPDTRPRECDVESDRNRREFGEDAGYYLDATEGPWAGNYQMFSYVNGEFYELILSHFNVDIDRVGILGHGMGGHGALISFFKRPGQYKSVSALAPMCNPMNCDWGRNAFTKLLGADETLWKDYDACELVSSYHGPMATAPVLIDQGLDDEYKDQHLLPDDFIRACANASFPVQLRQHVGYDHSNYFVMTFLEDHFKYHQKEFES